MPDTPLLLSIAALALAALAALLAGLILRRLSAIGTPGEALAGPIAALDARLDRVERVQRDEARAARDETGQSHRQLREEVTGSVGRLGATLSERLIEASGTQKRAFAEFVEAVRQSDTVASERMKAVQEEFGRRLELVEKANVTAGQTLRDSVQKRLEEQRLQLEEFQRQLRQNAADADLRQKASHDDFGVRLVAINETNARAGEALKTEMTAQLAALRLENEAKLEQMRATVDEKLQGTLEARLGESFKIVSERLEAVHKGLGEMQTLATGVGDLKRVLTNVKSRGGWGEVQLGALLEDMLTVDQFATNVRIQPGSSEIVEFAVRLPGRGGEALALWLPIDAKFPHEDYDRLLNAQDGAAAEEIEKAAQALERAIRTQARTISEKYVHPPHSTDFAIMYLPTEGLFAEVIRRPGLASDIQTKHRVMIQGPTTLAALLSSLQMGFRTLAIEKRSSEVWQVLGAAKAEFVKYGQVWEKLGKQLDTARKTVDEAGKRTRAVSRRLRDVETLEIGPVVTADLAMIGVVEMMEDADGEGDDGPDERFVEAAQ